MNDEKEQQMPQFFYFYDNEKKRGPYSAIEIKKYAITGVIKENTVIDINGTRYRADKIRGLLDPQANSIKVGEESTINLNFTGTVTKDHEDFIGLMDKHPIANFFGKFNGIIVAVSDIILILLLIFFLLKFDLTRFGITAVKTVVSVKIVAGVFGAAIIIGILSKEKQFVDNMIYKIKTKAKK